MFDVSSFDDGFCATICFLREVHFIDIGFWAPWSFLILILCRIYTAYKLRHGVDLMTCLDMAEC